MGKSQSQVERKKEKKRKMVKPACLLHIFHRVPAGRQCPLCPRSICLFLSACSLLSWYCSRLGSSRRELRPHSTCWYIVNRRMSHLSRLCSLVWPPIPLLLLLLQPLVCMYIPFLIKVDKCPPPPQLPLVNSHWAATENRLWKSLAEIFLRELCVP